jgi:hypothetical protein
MCFPNTPWKARQAQVRNEASELYGCRVRSLTKRVDRGRLFSDASRMALTDGGNGFVSALEPRSLVLLEQHGGRLARIASPDAHIGLTVCDKR